jgi:hypothetical protein
LIRSHLENIETTHCRLRPVTRDDVPFIYHLRREHPDQFLNPIPDGIEHQYSYFEKYDLRFENGDEVYYLIRDKLKDEDAGAVRLTDINAPGWYNWHSLIVRTTASPQVGIDVCALFYAIGFDILDKKLCGPWPVRKTFRKMIRIHEHMKMAKPAREDDEFYYYQVAEADYRIHSPALRRASFGVIKGLHDAG